MPTIVRIGPYRFFFYSNEGEEPPHVHIRRDRALVKFWLKPVDIARSTGFSARELSKVSKLVEENQAQILEAWNEYFGH